jgi:hypothetical protein
VCRKLEQSNSVRDASLERGACLGVKSNDALRCKVTTSSLDLLLVLDDDYAPVKTSRG